MNYTIIHDEQLLHEFIEWLPDLERHEKFYCCLLARKKYCSEDTKMLSDRVQLNRFLSSKKKLFYNIKQLEVEIGAYRIDNTIVPQEALVVYINPNPRDLLTSTYDSIIKLTESLKNKRNNINPHQEVMSCIQRSQGRKIYLDFDIDTADFDFKNLIDKINKSCLTVVKTNGGYHLLLKLSEIEDKYKNTFFKDIKSLGVDQAGDQLLPIPGCTQGKFIPSFMSLK